MGIARYVRLAPETLKMIAGSRLTFFYEEEFIGTLIARLCENFNMDVTLVRRPLTELPLRHQSMVISEGAKRPSNSKWERLGKEKGIGHLRSMDVNGDRSEYADNLTIWLSKISLANSVANECKYDKLPIAWMDIGLSKFNFIRENWNFSLLEGSNGRMLHYSSNMRYLGKQLPLNASFLLGWPCEWAILFDLFHEKLRDLQSDGYPHDEETILSHVVRENPQLFKCIGHPFRGSIGKLRYYYNRVFYGRIRDEQ